MATQAQILANRSNAQKSTGPRTAEGKAVVAKNAVKHGLVRHETVITGEDPGEFEFYRERMLEELDPAGEVESGLAERIVSLSWRLKRAERLQAAAFDSLYAKQKDSLSEKLDKSQDADGDSTLGRAIVRDFGNNRVLDRLLMYERRIEHSLYRTMAELKRHRLLQEVGPGGMWELRRALASEDEARTENRAGRTCYEAGCRRSLRSDGGGSTATARGWRITGGTPVLRTPAARRATRDERRGPRPQRFTTLSHCKTKPICPAANHGQVPCNAGVAADSPRRELDGTEPIRRAGAAFEDTPGIEAPACGAGGTTAKCGVAGTQGCHLRRRR